MNQEQLAILLIALDDTNILAEDKQESFNKWKAHWTKVFSNPEFMKEPELQQVHTEYMMLAGILKEAMETPTQAQTNFNFDLSPPETF